MKKIVTITLVIIMVFALTACGILDFFGSDDDSGSSGSNGSGIGNGSNNDIGDNTPPIHNDPTPPPVPVDPNERGNTASNLVNGGIAVYNDGWIYFSDLYVQTLIKMRADGSERTVLAHDVDYGNLNIVGDWIYFTEWGNIQKMRTDGTNRSRVALEYSSVRVGNMTVIGEWIYYTNTMSEQGLYKLKTDGTEDIKLLDGDIRYFNVSDDWIYYVGEYGELDDGSFGYPFIRMRTDGTEPSFIELVDSGIDDFGIKFLTNFIVDNGWIYATSNFFNFSGAMRFRIDGTDFTYLGGEGLASNIAVADGWVYYTTDNAPDYDLYRVSVDGGEPVKLATNRNFLNMNIVSDWIFFRGFYDGFYETNIIKIRTDGSGGFVLEGTPSS
ncbi:MAG: DUF5050 domain-containing protein [Oscillospiraceae bacterium]|jgi:hypothetical protein|nr:DUF5050 domain-containing protein [Oscillospiraceae bacterium]